MGINFGTPPNESAPSVVKHTTSSSSPGRARPAGPIGISAQLPPAERLNALEAQMTQLSAELRDLADSQTGDREEMDSKIKHLDYRIENEMQRLLHEVHAQMMCYCDGGQQVQEEDDHDHRVPSVFGLVGSRRRKG